MGKLGISIYPNPSRLDADRDYIEQASNYGFQRIFTCLLSSQGDQEEIISHFKETISYAKEKQIEVICDISPPILKTLDLSFDDLSFFHELGVDGLRFDMGFTGQEEAEMTYNPFGLKIEINMSNSTRALEKILDYHPNRKNLIGCHNFYPHRYAGLSYDFFIECSKKFKKQGLRTAAFVSSPSATFGPWPMMEGMPTLELHRNLPIDVQAKHLFATGLIDDVIISNAYASEEEMKALRDINQDLLTFNIKTVDTVSDLERKIIFEEPHFYRGDVSDYLIRSTQSRVKYRDKSFPVHHTPSIRRGDILIESDLYEQYAGELQIARKDMENSGKTNIVGRIREEEIFLIDYLKPWQTFKFIEWKK